MVDEQGRGDFEWKLVELCILYGRQQGATVPDLDLVNSLFKMYLAICRGEAQRRNYLKDGHRIPSMIK